MVGVLCRDGVGGKSEKLSVALSPQIRAGHQAILPDGSHDQRRCAQHRWREEDQCTGEPFLNYMITVFVGFPYWFRVVFETSDKHFWSSQNLFWILLTVVLCDSWLSPQSTMRDQAVALLELLLTKDNYAYISFYNSLVNEAYYDLATLLREDLPSSSPGANRNASDGCTPYGKRKLCFMQHLNISII